MNYEEQQHQYMERLEKRHQQMVDRLNRHQERLGKQLDRANEHMEREIARVTKEMEFAFDHASSITEKQQRIVDAALELLQDKGLNELSLREIAKKLHMQAPAIYWHFKSKEVLIDYMAEVILRKEFKNLRARADNQTWESWLNAHMLRLRKAMLSYPDGARVIAGAHPYPAITLGRTFEAALESLHSAGLPLETAARIVLTTTTYTFGYVIEEQSSPSNEQIQNMDLGIFLKHAPLTAQLLQNTKAAPISPEAEFASGLQLIIDGARAQI